jgi:hypothetical protein
VVKKEFLEVAIRISGMSKRFLEVPLCSKNERTW